MGWGFVAFGFGMSFGIAITREAEDLAELF